MTNQTAENLVEMLAANADFEKAKNFQRFFKTGPGEYAEGDLFLGLNVPMTRDVIKDFKQMPLPEIEKLAHSKYHEARLAAMLIMVNQWRATKDEQKHHELYKLYVKLLCDGRINNWDLIDTSAPTVLGGWLWDHDRAVLFKWITDENLWFRRAAILASFGFIARGESSTSLQLCELVLNDKHDLIHKGSGWMLREIGKRISVDDLRGFLEQHIKQMPRTMLRYAIERLPESERQVWLKR